MTVSTGDAAAGAGAIGEDVPCDSCGYDLRGLTPPGRCPECGRDLDASLREWARRRRPLPPPDPRWLSHIRAGAWCSLATFALLLATVIAVPSDVEWYRLRMRNAPIGETPARVCLLAVACAWWVLAWASAWRLTTPERLPRRRAAAFVAAAARWLASTYLLMPFVWARATWHDMYVIGPWLYVLIPLTVAGWMGAFLLLLQMGLLVRRVRRHWIPLAEAWVLAILVPVSALIGVGATLRRSGSTSLSLMFRLPAFPYGLPSLYQELVRWARDGWDEPLFWLLLCVPLWSLTLVLRLLVWSRSSAGGDCGLTPPEAPAEKTEASSHP